MTGYEANRVLEFESIVHEGEDSHSRMLLHHYEVLQSLGLIDGALKQMPNDPIFNKNYKFLNGPEIARMEQSLASFLLCQG